MKQIDESGLMLCRMQAKFFANSINLTECSSAVFLRRFMNSDVAKRFDCGGYLFEASSHEDLIIELDEQFGKTDYGSVKYSENELYWMGYIYRFWCYTHETSSSRVYDIIKPGELRKLYLPYHSLAPEAAIDRIIEAKGIAQDDLLQRGIELYRNIIGKNAG